jgi:NitT/TauT family transport system substrate-binding protein
MGANFVPSAATSSFYGSGTVIAELLKSNGQIAAIPDFAQTFDASFVEALSK